MDQQKAMVTIFQNLLSSGPFVPHGHCYLWKTQLVLLHVTSDSLIALAYYSIPFLLIYVVRKRGDLPFNSIFFLFGSFIVSCGTGHLMDIWTLWHPTYWLSGLIKALTASISLVTTVVLVLLIPQILAIPSNAQLEEANQKLEKEIVERQQAENELQQLAMVLEERVEQRTVELTQALQDLQQAQVQLLQSEKMLRQANEELEIRVEERTTTLKETLNQLQRTHTHLIQTEKMSSLGEMIAGIAHEINNPVNFIHANLAYAQQYAESLLRLAQLYQHHYPNPPQEIEEEIEAIDLNFLMQDFTELVKSMRSGTERIREIIKSLRNFSRLDEAELKRVNIHEGIDSTLMILEHRLQATDKYGEIKVIKEYGQLPLVACYPSQLNQVFMNIIANAIDVLEDSLVIDHSSTDLTPIATLREEAHRASTTEETLQSQWREGDPPATRWLNGHVLQAGEPFRQSPGSGNTKDYCSLAHQQSVFSNVQAPNATGQIHICTELLDENWVAITIADNGPGINEQVLSKLFDPFFTTKPVGKGTGIGLSISYQIIVEKHGGQLSCISALGKGATFQIKIPVSSLYQS